MQIINFMLHFPICINLQFRILKTYFSFLNKFYPNWTNFINSSSSFYLFPHTDTGDLLKANHTLSIVALGLSSNAHIQTEQSATIAELECSILILAATFVCHCGRCNWEHHQANDCSQHKQFHWSGHCCGSCDLFEWILNWRLNEKFVVE